MSKIELLRLREFRCFESLEYIPGPSFNFITGANAQGKTSILEAICLLLRLRSPRTPNLGEMVRFGGSGFSIEGMVEETRLSLTCLPPVRSLKIDGVAQTTSSDYLSKGRILWFGSDDLGLVSGAAERRRRLLDSAGIQLKGRYSQDLKIYDRALRSRNLLLREGGHAREIAAYNIPLSESGDRIISARRELVNALSPLAADACQRIAGESLELEYQPGASQPLLEALLANREEELRLRQTRVGPQRDDVSIRLDGIPAGAFASEGQRRTIAVALKLAVAGLIQKEHTRPPILLLDDIFGELDPPRRNALLYGIPEESQVFISTADLAGIALPTASISLKLAQGILHHL